MFASLRAYRRYGASMIYVKLRQAGELVNHKRVERPDDYLLVISAAYGEAEFSSFEAARVAAITNHWTVKLHHVPNRAPGATAGQTLVGHAPVSEAELVG